MKSIFDLQQMIVYSSRNPLREAKRFCIGFYSTFDNAYNAMQEAVSWEQSQEEEPNSPSYTMGYIIEEKMLDVSPSWNAPLFIHSYTRDGKLNDESFWADEERRIKPFYGLPEEKIRFKEGDIVEVCPMRSGDGKAELCIVGALPPSTKKYEEMKMFWKKEWTDFLSETKTFWDAGDNCYLLFSLGEGDKHSHVYSPYVFAPTTNVSLTIERKLKMKLQQMVLQRCISLNIER